jgi:serine/threonine-protein kinase
VAGQAPTVGRYELHGELGAGGFATVYRAYDPVLDREVALKVLHPHLGRDAATRERFVREGRALARVRHPNVVQVFDAGEANGTAYLAMELIEGRSLKEVADGRGPLPLAEVVAVAGQIAAALAAVHARNLVHRDIKPANILIESAAMPGGAGGRAVLLDLGVARALDSTAVTGTGYLVGTPGFMAPEQFDPDLQVTPQTDVYQLGATVYTLLAGRPPFEGEPTRVMYAIVHRPPPDLTVLRPDLPAGVVAVIAEALAKDPALRPAGTLAFAAQLRQMAGLGGGTPDVRQVALPPSVPTAAGAGVPAAELESARTRAAPPPPDHTPPGAPPPIWGQNAPPARRSPKRLLLLSGAGVVGLLLLAGAVVRARADDGPRRRVQAVTATATATPARPPVRSTTAAATGNLSRSATPPPPAGTPSATRTPPPATATATATRPPATAPGANVVALLEATMNSRGYVPDGNVVRVRATEAGGVLAVQKGICKDSATGRCQLLFIYLDERFLGTDTLNASAGISDIRAAGTGRFSASYANYAPNDPGCCPSRPPVTITYTWDGTKLTPDGTPPGD